ncbi:hypothetical protein DPMN_068886 [Dreissena polymorpha]|uniref:Uncharacterized protein n=1 Tax=Dreissena polymorpha TaxID=45954 RepID=A0A9D3YYE5_DREPO|nr:hypothetical protein DPMN_068886 [Dreissena polymorpha]
MEAIAETRPSGSVRWLGPPCSAGRPRSQAETNGPKGPERDSQAIRPRELGCPTRPARPTPTKGESRLRPPFTALRENHPSVQAAQARLPGPHHKARETYYYSNCAIRL